jgi:predicted transcriptional regulator YdeE
MVGIMTMQPVVVSVQPFVVSGLSARTVNRDEADPSRAKLPGLWGQFYGERLQDRIPSKRDGSLVYGVYSNYESDGSGPYTVTAGVSVGVPDPGYSSIPVQGGQYLVFESRGAMPQAVIDGWSAVWQYFGQPQKLRRVFATDYEEYRGPDHVAIFISVGETSA